MTQDDAGGTEAGPQEPHSAEEETSTDESSVVDEISEPVIDEAAEAPTESSYVYDDGVEDMPFFPFYGDARDPEPKYDEELDLYMEEGPYLTQWDPVRRGYVRKLRIHNGDVVQTFYMETLSLNPPIFEIPNYLSDDERAFIKQYVHTTPLATSAMLTISVGKGFVRGCSRATRGI